MIFDYARTAGQILEVVDGKANMEDLTRCIIKLHFMLKDMGLPKGSEAEEIPGVLWVVRQGGRYQVVIGNEVTHVFAELQKLGGFLDGGKAENGDPKENLFSRLCTFMAGCMTPLLPAMLGCGAIKMILTLPTAFSLVDTTGSTYIILSTVGDAFFHFTPIMLACTTAKRLNSNLFLAMVMATMLLHPNLGALLLRGNTSYFGLPITSAPCSSSVLPVLLMVPLMKWIERSVDKICLDMVKVFLKPLIIIFVSVPAVLIAIGPIGAMMGNYLVDGVNFLYNKIDWLTITVLSIIIPLTVMTGMHYVLIPIHTISLASFGYDAILITTMFYSNLTQGGASVAVAIGTKDSTVKSTASAARISAIMAGVIGPVIYEITLKYKTSMITAVYGVEAFGLYPGITYLVGCTMGGSPSVLTFIQMIGGEGLASFLNGVIALAISLGASFLVSLVLYKPDPAETGEEEATSTEGAKTLPWGIKPLVERIEIKNPLNGAVISLKEVLSPVFFGGVLGEGAAVIPSGGKVYAPAGGMINVVMDSRYAVGITADNQAEIPVHVGLDAVNLKGEDFDLHCKVGDRVKVGDLLLESGLDLLEEKDYDVVTPVLIPNPADFISIKAAETREIVVGEVLLTIA